MFRRRKKEKKKSSSKPAAEGEEQEDLEICLGSGKDDIKKILLQSSSKDIILKNPLKTPRVMTTKKIPLYSSGKDDILREKIPFTVDSSGKDDILKTNCLDACHCFLSVNLFN